MASLKISSLAASAAAAAAAASLFKYPERAYADGAFRFSPFSSSSSSPQDSQQTQTTNPKPEAVPEPEAPPVDSYGMDPDMLDRGAKALRTINNSRYRKQVFDVMRKQEEVRLKELEAEKAQHQASQARDDVERQRKMAQEQFGTLHQQAQLKAQSLRHEDELIRKRVQTEHENKRRQNVELVKMQSESSIKQEKKRIATEAQIQAQQRQTEKERAELERETLRIKAMAEAEARAREAKLTEDTNRRVLVQKMQGEKEKWLAAINTTFSHIEGGFRMLLDDRSKLIMAVGGTTALAAGVYTTREGARVTWGYINRILGQPSLIRESSIGKFPWSGMVSGAVSKVMKRGKGAVDRKTNFGSIVLHPSLQRRIEQLSGATANTKAHQAPFRNMLFYGPPGTGKTMVAREIARKSGLDYAMMTGGDVAPLGPEAVTKIHQIFDWAKKSRKGLLLFIDEADAFLCQRNSTHMSEAQRSALNALLFRTGDQSRDIVLVLATNRPGDLDSAITDRIDEVIEFPIPGVEERVKLLKLYMNSYLSSEDKNESRWGPIFRAKPQKIIVKDISEDVIQEAARKTEGFSGREIAKLMASVQAAVYGSPDCTLDSQLFTEIVDYKVAEHHRRMELITEGGR